jgi:hypothetical protein
MSSPASANARLTTFKPTTKLGSQTIQSARMCQP